MLGPGEVGSGGEQESRWAGEQVRRKCSEADVQGQGMRGQEVSGLTGEQECSES